MSWAVLVLAPGTSLSDWRGENVPTLRRLSEAFPFGVAPTGPAGTRFEAACRALAYGARAPGPGDEPLGDVLAASGVHVAAVADPTGAKDEAVRILAGATLTKATAWRVPNAAAPDGLATDPLRLAGAVRATFSPGRRVLTVALFDDLARVDRAAPLALPEATRKQRRDALKRFDDLLRDLTTQNSGRAPDVVLVVTPQPSFAATGRGERLGPVLLWRRDGSESNGGLLTSPSTRRTSGLIAGPDVAATIAGLLGAVPESVGPGAGRVVEVADRSSRGESDPAYLARRVAAWAAQVREQRLLVAVPWLLAGALLVGALCRRARREKAATALALWAACVPPGLLLAGLFAPSGVGQAWVVYALAFGLSLAAPLFFWATSPRVRATRVLQGVAALTTGALLLDPWLGAPLLGRAPLSYSVVEAARYYGMGNEASGAFLGASIVTASGLLFSRAQVAGFVAAVLLALAATATLALPGLGADFGGLIAALAGFGTLLLAPVLGVRSAARRRRLWAGGALVSVALFLIAALVVWDAKRPAGERTHVGQAVARVARGDRKNDFGALETIVVRKAATAARLLVTSPWSLLLLAEIAAFLLVRGRRRVATPAAFPAIAVAAAAALLVNDSGVVTAALCLLWGAATWLAAPPEPPTKTGRAEVA